MVIFVFVVSLLYAENHVFQLMLVKACKLYSVSVELLLLFFSCTVYFYLVCILVLWFELYRFSVVARMPKNGYGRYFKEKCECMFEKEAFCLWSRED
jgi:hypothetical protein